MTGLQRRLFRAGNKVSVWLYRRSGGKLGGKARGGTPVLILTVKGRKSGQPFSCPAVEERQPIWDEQKALYPGFADYETKSGRSMPVALLTPR